MIFFSSAIECWEEDRDYGGNDIGVTRVWSACACAKACLDTDDCVRASFQLPEYGSSKSPCYLKRASTAPASIKAGLITVYPSCGEWAGKI